MSKTGAILLLGLLLGATSGCHQKRKFGSHGLRSVEIRMRDEDMGAVLAGARDGLEYPATVLIDGDAERATISVAGQSTIDAPKKSLNVHFENARYRGAAVVRLGANTGDDTMIRPLIALELMAAAGLPHSWAEPAFVHLNDRILGLYVFMERVDEDYFANRGIPWDRVYEAIGDADFGPHFEARIDFVMDGKPKPPDLTAMLAVRRTLEIADDADFLAALFRILDRDSVVNYMAASQMLYHWDGFNKNLFYYRDTRDRLIHLAPWDFDLDLPSEGGGGNQDAWYLNSLFSRIGRIATMRAAIDGKIAALEASGFSKADLVGRVATWKDVVAEGFAHDPALGAAGRSLDDAANGLARAISNRLDAIP